MVSNAFQPMILFACVAIVLGILAQIWAHHNEARHRELEFWTGGLGVLGIIAVGCAAFVLVWAARVFDDSLRAIQRDAATITDVAAKTSDQLGRSVNIVGALEKLLSRLKPQE
jgi:nitric oxide reductase large subunit